MSNFSIMLANKNLYSYFVWIYWEKAFLVEFVTYLQTFIFFKKFWVFFKLLNIFIKWKTVTEICCGRTTNKLFAYLKPLVQNLILDRGRSVGCTAGGAHCHAGSRGVRSSRVVVLSVSYYLGWVSVHCWLLFSFSQCLVLSST
jgi:hypothetical protein